ncbi:MAG: hypothetical protein PVF68_04545 [Acidobacteriota bacterium]|jgi:hypothetical protein
MRPETARRALAWLLRINGALACLAIVAVFFPTVWIDAGSRLAGLGPFPDTVLTQYLVRSVSAIYALLGALVLYLAAHVEHHRQLVVFVGWLTVALGAALTGIDFSLGMPASWSWGEGPPTVVVGVAIVWLGRLSAPGGSSAGSPSRR